MPLVVRFQNSNDEISGQCPLLMSVLRLSATES